MPFEIYFIPHNPENEVTLTPLLPGQKLGTISLSGEIVDGIAITCDENGKETLVYRKEIGPANKDGMIEVPNLVNLDNIKGRATEDESCTMRASDLDGKNFTIFIRCAGKTAINPALN